MTTKTKPTTTPLDLRPDPANPNRLDAETKAGLARALAEFGDLSGCVVNRRTGLLIGGHQRADVLRDGTLHVKDLPTSEPDGTVARGWLECNGRRYAVRVVDWPEDRAHAALLAANRYGRRGEDDAATLKDLLAELDCGQVTDTGQLLADLTGYDAAERERLALQVHVPDGNKPIDEEAMSDTKNECPKCGFRW
jgi:hypothetical protein